MGEDERTLRHELKNANFMTFCLSSLTVRMEVCSYELLICSVNKKLECDTEL